MRAELASLNNCAVLFLSRAAVNMSWYCIYYTSFNPQNLRNIIKKVAKINITQINYYRTCLSKQQYFSMYFTGLG